MRRNNRSRRPVRTWRTLVISDLRRYRPDQEPSVILFFRTAATTPGLVASSILRAQQTLNGRGWHTMAGTLRHVGLALSNLDLVPGAEVGPGLLMHHPNG